MVVGAVSFALPSMAGESPKVFRQVTGDYSGEGTLRQATAVVTRTGELDGTMAITQPDPPRSAIVAIESILDQRGFLDSIVFWTYEFRRKGRLSLTVRYADGSTGIMRGTYETKRSTLTYRGTMEFNNGMTGRSRGIFKLRGKRISVRDKIVLPTQTIRSKQVFRRDDD